MSEDGFLSRWARRKAEVRAGRTVSEAPQRPDAAPAGQDEAARGPAGRPAPLEVLAPSRETPAGTPSRPRPGDWPPTPAGPAAAHAAEPIATPGATVARLADARGAAMPEAPALRQPAGAGVEPGIAGAPSTGPTGAPPTVPTGGPSTTPADEPPPTLEEATRLAPGADVSRFVRRGVDASVQRTALKRLFADPHFNIMDGLDVYIDDYGKPDPIPEAMLRQMNQSRFLGLFEDTQTAQTGEPAIPAPASARSGDRGQDTAHDPSDGDAPAQGTAEPQTAQDTSTRPALDRDLSQDLPAPSSPAHDAPVPDAAAAHPAATQPTAHEDPDLQLQPDDRAGRTGPEERAGTGRA